jgi:hypothetical protein
MLARPSYFFLSAFAGSLLVGAALAVGCAHPSTSIGIADVVVTPSDDVATVLTATWTTSAPATGRVRFGLEGALDRVTPDTEEGTEHSMDLLGLPADADVSVQVEVGTEHSETVAVPTGALPADIPTTTASGDAPGQFLLTTATGPANWILMIDDQGRTVWYHRDDRGLSVFRARPSVDGTGIVYTSVIENGLASPDSEVIHVPWAGGAEQAVAVPDLAHDFVEQPDGTVVSLAFATQDGVEGNDLLAIDAAGAATEVWSTWDCFDPVENPGDDPEHGWTHANAVDLDPVTGQYTVGLRNLATLAVVDPTDRSCPWALGGSGGTLEISGARFIHEHQFERTADGMLVFDNDGAPGNESRAIEYAIDLPAGTATERTTFVADPPLYSFIMGDVHRFLGGDTLVLWSTPGMIDRMDPDGVRVWRVEIGADGPLGFVEALDDPYAR